MVGGRTRFTTRTSTACLTSSPERESAARGEYVDTHNWVFTPHHFRLLLVDLGALGLVSLRERAFHDAVGPEFYVTLSADGAGPGAVARGAAHALGTRGRGRRADRLRPALEQSRQEPWASAAETTSRASVLDQREVVGALEALGVDLVDVLGAGRAARRTSPTRSSP